MGDWGPLLTLCREVTLKIFLKEDKQKNSCLLNTYFMPGTLDSLIYPYKYRYSFLFTIKATESQLVKLCVSSHSTLWCLFDSTLIIIINKANTKGLIVLPLEAYFLPLMSTLLTLVYWTCPSGSHKYTASLVLKFLTQKTCSNHLVPLKVLSESESNKRVQRRKIKGRKIIAGKNKHFYYLS